MNNLLYRIITIICNCGEDIFETTSFHEQITDNCFPKQIKKVLVANAVLIL